MDTKTATHKSHGTSALGLALAAAIGIGLGLIFAPKDGSSIRKSLLAKIKDLAHMFNKNRVQVQEAVKDIWGEVTDELEKDYVEVRSHIFAAIDEIGDKADVTKRKFEHIIDDTVEEYSKDREWTHASKNKLAKSLKDEWEDIKAKITGEESEREEVNA